MARQIVVGIDIGSFETKVIIAEASIEQGHFSPKIIGTGTAESRGVERGYIVSRSDAASSLRVALNKAEKMAGVKARKAYVAFGGIGLGSIVSSGSTTISRGDMEITERDVQQAIEAAEKSISPAAHLNKKIINTIPMEYKLNNEISWGDPVGLKAHRLDVKVLFITCLEHHVDDLIKTVEEADVEVVDVVAAPVAASFVTVSKKQRRVGCLLSDIGADTLSVIAFENNNPTSLEVFPIGGNDITNDIALGLKMTLEDAENVKLGGISRVSYSKKKLDDIISARLGDCFELVSNHLKKIGRHKLLPAGVILVGGTSNTPGIKAVAEADLGLPAQVAEIHFGSGDRNKIKDNIWAVSCGLILLGFNSNEEGRFMGPKRVPLTAEDGQRMFKKLSKWFSQLLP